MLIGKKLTDIGRAADMAWIILEEYNIDIISEFIFIKDDVRIIDSNDIYIETGEIEPIHQRPISVYDNKVQELLAQDSFTVSEITTDKEDNLCIFFSGGLSFQTTSKINYECGQMCHLLQNEKWRIFAQHTKLPHMVARRTGIEWE